jgi:beta-galactosidase
MKKENRSHQLNRRDALIGLTGFAATPLLAEHGTGEQKLGPSAPTAKLHPPPLVVHGRDQSFDQDWRFHRGDVPGAEAPGFDDSHWRKLDLPHDWSIEDLTPVSEALGEGTIWVGGNAPTRIGPFDVALSAGQEATGWVVGATGYYRKHFRIPASGDKSEIEIRFDGVYMNSDVWLNGQHVGFHPYGYTSFAYNLTPYLNHDGENILAVRVRNEGQNSRWYSGSGIYRHVWLTLTEKVRLPLWGVSVTTPKVAADLSTVEVAVKVENRDKTSANVTVRTQITGPKGEVAGKAEQALDLPASGESTSTHSFEIQSPYLWSHATPHLYRAEVELLAAGKVVDRSTVSFGIRSIEVDIERGLRINGELVKLKGGCVHHDNGILGSAAIDRAEERRVEILKANGFNAIRTSHNPPSPAFLDACDRLGMMVIDEAFDCWNLGKNDVDYHLYFNDWWERDIKSMAWRDRNHPSVIFWSIGNEIDGRRTPEGVAIAKQLHDAVKSIDPVRPITMAVPGPYDHNLPEWQANDPCFLHLDVGGYNYQWQQYEVDHQRFPQRIMMGTESFPIEAFDSWRSAEKLSYVLGDFVWTAIDYLGESAIGHSLLSQEPANWRQKYPWFISYCGDIDAVGHKKPQSYYRDVLWGQSKLEMAVQRPLPAGRTETLASWGWVDELRSWTWPGVVGKPLNVRVYTSGDEVKLLLNGEEVGSKLVPESAKLIAEFPVPYAEGELRAIAFKDGKEIASQTLKTVGMPARLHLSTDRQAILASRNDLAFVTVEILDAAGTPFPDGVRTIDFQIEGVGELAAAGSANPKDVTSFRQPTCRTFRGKCVAILRPTGHEGTITLRATSAGLQPATVAVTCSPHVPEAARRLIA